MDKNSIIGIVLIGLIMIGFFGYQSRQIKKQEAELKKIDVDIEDSTLYAHYDGRVQDLLAHEGEVLSAGGRVMSIVALTGLKRRARTASALPGWPNIRKTPFPRHRSRRSRMLPRRYIPIRC